MCLCATSVPSERVFSCGGNIVTGKRTSVKPEKIDNLVFLTQKFEVTNLSNYANHAYTWPLKPDHNFVIFVLLSYNIAL